MASSDLFELQSATTAGIARKLMSMSALGAHACFRNTSGKQTPLSDTDRHLPRCLWHGEEGLQRKPGPTCMRLEAVHAGFQVPEEVLCPLALVQQHRLQLPVAGLHTVAALLATVQQQRLWLPSAGLHRDSVADKTVQHHCLHLPIAGLRTDSVATKLCSSAVSG